jgi:glutamate racemase
MLRLPSEDYVYVADSAHCPYGSRTEDDVRRLSRAITRFLLEQGAKLVVVACNTASAAALADLRVQFSIPIVGMVPAVKPAAHLTTTGVVGVLATPVTFHGELYHRVLDRDADGVRVSSQVCHGLVECVERGETDGPQVVKLLDTCIAPLLAEGADTLVLGCTHYAFLAPAIRRLVGEGVTVVEPSDAIARQVGHVLDTHGLSRSGGCPGKRAFYSSGDTVEFARTLYSLTGWLAEVKPAQWRDGVLLPA